VVIGALRWHGWPLYPNNKISAQVNKSCGGIKQQVSKSNRVARTLVRTMLTGSRVVTLVGSLSLNLGGDGACETWDLHGVINPSTTFQVPTEAAVLWVWSSSPPEPVFQVPSPYWKWGGSKYPPGPWLLGTIAPKREELAGSEQAIEEVHSDVLSSVPDPFAPLATNPREQSRQSTNSLLNNAMQS
jgi:hypothetical protein